MKIFITVDDIITSSGLYPERAKSPELTTELKSNAAKLCDAVNGLLTELKWNKPVSISSGFRPSAVNANVKGASKRSSHMECQAIDLVDNGELCLLFFKNQDVAKKHNLYMEDPRWTLRGKFGSLKGWSHWQIRPTSKQIFIPYSDWTKNPPNTEVEKLLK